MTNPYLQRPQRPNNNPNRPQQPGNRNNNNRGGGGHNSGGGGGQGGGNHPEPSPWLIDSICAPHETASFVEYLRWMREPNRNPGKNGKDPTDPTTKLQIMQIAEETANYQVQLGKRNDRTKRLAGDGNWFEVTCPWRIRVGGTKGPESMLLPAFDHVGMPYIPSSTLRGIARTYAIRHFMQTEGMDWETSDRHVEMWFGHLEAKNKEDKSGKVIFFDAYPTPSNNGGLAMDMANSIWRWDGDQLGGYSPNPNVFFSLKNVSFLIGLRPVKPEYAEAVQQVRIWLIAGLAQGAGSQVNSGYGVLEADESTPTDFLRLEFDVKGQKIHGAHRFSNLREPFKKRNGVLETDRNGNLKPDTFAQAELRATALKNMMRYWFRVFARGVLPSGQVRKIEAQIFGGIELRPTWGWLCVRVKEIDPPEDSSNTQSGILSLFATHSLPEAKKDSFQTFCKELCWLMFRLGGIGQGSRRPYYERQGNPRIRGCDLIPYDSDSFWQVPDEPDNFAKLFQSRLKSFYRSLTALVNVQIQKQNLGEPTRDHWIEVADKHCAILVFHGQHRDNKSHALVVLHNRLFKHNGNYDRFLCGSTTMPSPVWIANVEDKGYQIATVFGATVDPRRRYVEELRRQGAIQVFPLSSGG